MELQEYNAKLDLLKNEFEQAKINLAIDFIKSNNPYNVGDVITDHVGTIKINYIKYSMGSFGSPPCAVYYGIELNKDGSQNKRGNTRCIYQSNLKTN